MMTDIPKAFNLVYIYLFLEQGKLGTGRHIWDVRAVDTVKLTKVCVSLSNGPDIQTNPYVIVAH